ncbi:MAG TPA: potassium-transporting ATPase subunit C, partial [Planctomycetota bacterium]|nr:potassium-transporting ATPase subunit C [Planctomycetota bacterium]
MQHFIASLRVAAATLVVCVVGYAATILAVAQVVTPATANGHLVEGADAALVGSRLIAQAFSEPRYFWPRPSAVGYDGAGAGGSNQSPTSDALTERAQEFVARHGATPE